MLSTPAFPGNPCLTSAAALLISTLCCIPCQLQLETLFCVRSDHQQLHKTDAICCCLCRAMRRWCPSSKLHSYML